MTLHTEEVDLGDELARLREERAELVEKAAALPADNQQAAKLEKLGKTLDRHIAAVEWAREKAHTDEAIPTRDGEGKPLPGWDEPAETLTFGSLGGSELGMIEDRTTSKAASHDLQSTKGLARVETVAAGTVDAPYHAPSASRDAQVQAVAKLPHPFLKWAEATILEMSMLGNRNAKSFAAAVDERREQTQSDESDAESAAST